MISGLDDLPGLNVSWSGTVNQEPSLAFGGANGGSGSTLQTHDVWIIEFTMPEGSSEVPSLELNIEVA